MDVTISAKKASNLTRIWSFFCEIFYMPPQRMLIIRNSLLEVILPEPTKSNLLFLWYNWLNREVRQCWVYCF
jgi:hypothetical protein